MPVSPLFLTDMDDLKERLRLNDVQEEAALAIIDDQVLRARLRFLDHLGSDRVQEIQGYTPTDSPFTDEERLRTKAELCEVMLVRQGCLGNLPTIFADSSGEAFESWNESAFVRDYGAERFKTEKNRAEKLALELEVTVIKYLDDLKGDPQDDSKVDITVIETETSGRRLNSIYVSGSHY